MSLFDIGIIIIITLFMVSSYKVGFIEEIFTLLSIIFSFVAAYTLSPLLATYLTFLAQNLYVVRIIAGIIIYIVVYLFLKLVRDGIFDFIEEANLSPIDRMLGLLLGFLKGIIFAGFFVFILSQIDFKSVNQMLDNSILSHILLQKIELTFKI